MARCRRLSDVCLAGEWTIDPRVTHLEKKSAHKRKHPRRTRLHWVVRRSRKAVTLERFPKERVHRTIRLAQIKHPGTTLGQLLAKLFCRNRVLPQKKRAIDNIHWPQRQSFSQWPATIVESPRQQEKSIKHHSHYRHTHKPEPTPMPKSKGCKQSKRNQKQTEIGERKRHPRRHPTQSTGDRNPHPGRIKFLNERLNSRHSSLNIMTCG